MQNRKETWTLEELIRADGVDLGTTGFVHLTQEQVDAFAEVTRAKEWIHVDVARARRESPFGGTVMHGYLTLALATHFITQLLPVDPQSGVGINYGLAKVRFPAPVPVGAGVRGRGRLAHAEPYGDGVRTFIELVIETRDSPKPACVAEVISLFVPARELEPG